jgi:hypothetical protein
MPVARFQGQYSKGGLQRQKGGAQNPIRRLGYWYVPGAWRGFLCAFSTACWLLCKNTEKPWGRRPASLDGAAFSW